jgi:5-hydroxyisourate hydrolase
MTRSHVTSHVLDAATGRPAVGIAIALEHLDDGVWVPIAIAATDNDGRVKHLGGDRLELGTYRVRFNTGDWFAESGVTTFYPEVIVPFAVVSQDEHYHVPLLLSPFAYSTYRGS